MMDVVQFMMHVSKINDELKKDFMKIYFPIMFFGKDIHDKEKLQIVEKYIIKRREILNFIRYTSDPKIKTYFNNIVNSGVYQILNGSMLTILKLDTGLDTFKECPICWDENTEHIVVTTCGHTSCLVCFEKLIGINSYKGTVKNKLLNMYNDKNTICPPCPVCRCSKAFTDFYIYNLKTKEVLTDIYVEDDNITCSNGCCIS